MCLFHAFRATNKHKTSLATSEVHVAAEEVPGKRTASTATPSTNSTVTKEQFGDLHGGVQSYTEDA
jgi:hypothetical protein